MEAIAIVWGKKKRVDFLGLVADYCIICRKIQPFYVQEIGMVSHVYWIPHGDVDVLGHMGICKVCGISMCVDRHTYKGFSPDCDIDIEQLIDNTYPTIREDLRERLELYEIAKRCTTIGSEDVRESMILEPFLILAPIVQEKFGLDVALTPAAIVSCICTILLPIVLLAIGGVTKVGIWYVLSGTSFVSGIVITWLFQNRSRRSFFQTSILPALVHSLRELNPKIQEIDSALESCVAHGLKIGTKFRSQQVLNAIQDVQHNQVRYSHKRI
jgi:hypothetical protein